MTSDSQEILKLRELSLAAVLSMFVLVLVGPKLYAQSNPSAQDSATKPGQEKPRVKSHDSVTVNAKLTPEEAEEGKLNDAYQAIYVMEQKNDCGTAIQRYKSEVIPL